MNRRSFLTSTATATATAAVGVAGTALARAASDPKDKPASSYGGGHARKPIKLGIATYSYWHFRDPKVSIETVIDKSAEIGVEGLDILHRQMDIPEREPLTPAH